ncbi:MAG: hypothetical protein A2017_18120 [Lentisphaerae bacterium GWF2_44_16]|nr:MAG: hypothetical protein A2017_18120 [Lentisphaerae bacterium GWF2_44_16]
MRRQKEVIVEIDGPVPKYGNWTPELVRAIATSMISQAAAAKGYRYAPLENKFHKLETEAVQ